MRVARRVEDGEDRREVLCTTYQMRNPMVQFGDAVARPSDLHCYAQHAHAAEMFPDGGRVLDVCCGRGLMIPFLRYVGSTRRRPSFYVGVDIHRANATWVDGDDPRRRAGVPAASDWGFPAEFVESDAAGMTGPVRAVAGDGGFDLVVYTSAIEHMQPSSQEESLLRCAELARDGAVMYLSCPVTEPGRSGYECTYRAHVYEPSEEELTGWLSRAGWVVERRIGLVTSAKRVRSLRGPARALADQVRASCPAFLRWVAIAAAIPDAATEVAFVCRRVA